MSIGASGQVKIAIKISGENTAGGALRRSELDLNKVERSAKSVAGAIKQMGLDALLNNLQRVGQGFQALWATAKEGQEANNIQRMFIATVDQSAEALERARQASLNSVDDTTLQKRLIALQRMNLSLDDQARLITTVTKLVQTSGDREETVFRKVLGAMKGRKMALRDYGIEIKDASNALNEMDAALGDVDLSKFQTGVSQLQTVWDNFKSTVQQTTADALTDAIDVYRSVDTTANEAAHRWNAAMKEADKSTEGWQRRIAELHVSMEEIKGARFIRFLEAVSGATIPLAKETKDLVAQVDELNRVVTESVALAQSIAITQQAAANATKGDLDARFAADIEMTKRMMQARKSRGGGRGGRGRSSSSGAAGPSEFEMRAGEAQLEIQWRERALQMSEARLAVDLAQLELEHQRAGLSKQEAVAAMQRENQIRRQLVALREESEIKRAQVELDAGLIMAGEAKARTAIAQLEARRAMIALDQQESAAQMAADAERDKAGAKAGPSEMQERIDKMREFASVFQEIAGLAAESENQIVESISKMLVAIDSQFAALEKGGPSAISAMGKVASAGIKNTKAIAVVRGAFEAAAAIASFASQDYASGVLHLISSAMYFATAGQGGGSKGAGAAAGAGGARARTSPEATAGSASAARGGRTVNVYINSPAAIIGTPTQQAGAALGQMVDQADRSGFGRAA